MSYQGLNLINFLVLYCNEYLRTAGITSTIFCFPKHWHWTEILRIWTMCVHNCIQSGALCNVYHKSHVTVVTHCFQCWFDALLLSTEMGHWNCRHMAHILDWNLNTNEVRIAHCYLQFTLWDTEVSLFHFHDNICKRNRKWYKVNLLRVLINIEDSLMITFD